MNIVCTGYGLLAPKTTNVEQYLSNLKDGMCSLDVVDQEGPKGESNIIGSVNEGLEELEADKKMRRLPKVAKMGISAAKEALQSADLDMEGKKVGVFFGLSLGSTGEKILRDGIQFVNDEDYRKIPITFAHYANYHSITSSITHAIGLKGITKTISTGCTASLEAIEEAMLYLNSGKIDVAVVGGTDSPISKITTYSFAKTRVLPLDQSLEEGAIPFQEGSKGFAMAEAAGAIILEREDDAVNRSADIKGEIVDVVSNNDGIYIYSLDETGEQMINALKEVTEGRQPNYINSQALGIQVNDRIEEKCSELLFNHETPYTSIKSMYGNPFGAIGILQVISSLLSVQHGFIPPTIRTTTEGYETMNIVTESRFENVEEVAITNHGYGGNNACAYVKKHT
ncbi:beta-ketoacyl synthase N-terminal-like domain-containing protein [Lentibacillus jeotgali]|uniref:beta-ketoacyl synthase N-terminal-like domain-containing protein n=1 Tax=Lentibacillus jeotgali TaxID=558169 RepID=UPI00026267E8|nr:beta-ketoacyl synthase N-terminal-like domain-containing protein [Lentibacillus jeotgali]